MDEGRHGAKATGRGVGRQGLPAGLSQGNLNAAGIDVGASSHFVAVPADRADQPVREFGAFTADLYRLAEWLAGCEVETVVMESRQSTGYPCSGSWKSGDSG